MSPEALPPLLVVVGVFVLFAAVTGIRHSVPRRLAIRSIIRRPGETTLVIIGSMLGTAIITGSFIVGDTLDSSIRAGATTQLGPIDEQVTAPGTQSLQVLRGALQGLEEEPEIDGVTFGVRASGTAAARLGSGNPGVKPAVVLLEFDFDESRDFGGDPEATGLGDVPTPSGSQAVISNDLAQEIGVAVGDAITVFAYGGERELGVSGVLPRLGLAGYSTDFSSQSFNVFLAPGTLEGLVSVAPPELEASPPFSLGLVSNEGDALDGEELTDEAMPLVEDRVGDVLGANVLDTKRQVVEAADEVGSQFSELFLSIGAFAVIAGILLLVNIFVMLADERKGELGTMRAVGMKRGQLIRAFYLEGSLYATVAAGVGAVVGIGVGAAIVRVAANIFSGGTDFVLELNLSATLASILGGFLIGLFISLLTALVTSARISRLNIIRAIRDIAEPPRRRPRRRSLILGFVSVLLGLFMIAGAVSRTDAASAFAGPGVLAIGLTLLLRRIFPRRPVVTVLALGVVAWGIFGPTLLPDVFGEAETPVFVLQGVLLTGAGVAVLANNQEFVGRVVRRLVGGARNLAARLGLAYPLAKRFRTAMTLSMYALVVFTLVFISLLGNIFGGQIDEFTDEESGGYSMVVRSSPANPLPAAAVEQVEGVSAVAPLRYAAFSVEFKGPGRDDYEFWALSGFDERFIEGGPPALEEWAPEYGTEDEVWRAVLDDPSLIILDGFFLQSGGPQAQAAGLGDAVQIRDPLTGTEEERTVVARSAAGFAFSGPFISEESMLEVIGERAAPSRLYVALEEGTPPAGVARTLEADYIPNGVEVRTFRAIVSESQSANLQFFRLMQGYLALGLVVGISGLGVIMVRAVRERRREIGVLRSLGFQPGTVGRSFLLESGFVALEGLVLGAGLSIATAYQLFSNAEVFGDLEVSFTIPWLELAILLSLTLVASLAATGWPARQASRIKPAVALRITD